MSTKTSEDDFVNALAVLRGSLPRSGAKGRDDRLSKAGVFEDFFNWNRRSGQSSTVCDVV